MTKKTSKILTTALYAALALAAAWLSLRYFLPWLAPFLLSFGVAALMEPAVRKMCEKGRFKRGMAAGMCTLAFVGLSAGLIYLLCSRVCSEISALADRMPEMLRSASATIIYWQTRLGRYIDAAPAGVAAWAERAVEGLSQQLLGLPAFLSEKLLGFLSAMAGAAPAVMLFTITALVGIYFVSASYPAILRFVKLQIPERFLDRARTMRRDLRRTLGKWLRAQLIMTVIIFFELALAFALLKVNYALLMALFTAVVDMLPVLGTGTVLIPWAVYDFVTGEVGRGIGLLISYGAAVLLRNCIQAKLLGDQLGLHPLVTLLSIYVGYKIWGVWGMILFPILAISLKQLNDSGIIRLWKTEEEENVGSNIQYNSGHGHERSGRHEYPSG